MKFKHLLLYSFFAIATLSCTKNKGDNFTTAAPDPDATASTTPAAPITITVGADAPPANGDNSNLLFGNPTNATGDVSNSTNYLINQGYYVESYNATKLEPNWVSWHLDLSNIGSTSRSDSFAAFAGLPTGFVQVQSTSYQPYATYGFDRGHNCPSADRTSTLDANNATFLMTNMIPQAPANNQQTWGNFEGYLRGLVTSGGKEIYIIMGSYGTGGIGLYGNYSKIGVLGVNVPSNVWKVAVVLTVGNGDLARTDATTRVISINTPNIQSINSDWKQYIVPMSDIEAKGGVSLLSALPKSIHDALAVKVDPGI